MKMNFEETDHFRRNLKKLEKRYRSLQEDLDIFENIISVIPLGNSKHFTVLVQTGEIYVIKARLFCRYLKGSSLRIIYGYNMPEITVCFLELYFKGDRQNESRERINEYFNFQK